MIKKIFDFYNLSLDKTTLEQFEKFLELFKEKNSQVNLSSLRDDESIIEKHFVDSLILTKYLELSGKIADIGTGGGFPLLPLSIYLNGKDTNLDFYGIDSVAKKLKAIDEFALDLGLDNVTTIHSRFEELGLDKNYRDSFDFVVSRATAYFPTLLEYAIPLLKVGGIFVAYKMDNENEILEGGKALILLKSEIIYIKKYKLGGQIRSLVFVKKNEKTLKDYPRSSQIIARKPL